MSRYLQIKGLFLEHTRKGYQLYGDINGKSGEWKLYESELKKKKMAVSK